MGVRAGVPQSRRAVSVKNHERDIVTDNFTLFFDPNRNGWILPGRKVERNSERAQEIAHCLSLQVISGY